MKTLKNLWPIFLLLLIELVLFLGNYKHGAYLIGWDNLMPEFNILLNLKRSVFSVWQDYRGLGLPDGMAHAANLTHTIYIYILSLFLPQNLLRYSFILIIHLLGGIAFFLLVKNLLKNNKIALFSSLFYMFNLGVIQMFYAPLEVFVFHYLALPLLALLIKNVFEKTSLKNLLLLLAGSFLVSPQGFVPTIFGVFLLLLISFAAVDFWQNRNLKKILIIGFFVFAANSFWILPYTYTVLGNAKIIQSTKINQFSSEEIFYRNRARGDLLSVIYMKGFILDSIEYENNTGSDTLFMKEWRGHFRNVFVNLFNIVFIIMTGFGMVYSIFKKQKGFYPYLITFFVAFFFLANNTPVLEQLNNILRSAFPVLGEALRFPFTKFIMIFAFSFSIFLGLGLLIIVRLFRKLSYLIYIPAFLGILLLALPALQGHFFSPLLKQRLPQDYNRVFSFFSSVDKSRRVALLPTYTFWNWQYRNWGHLGSGFDWYGIEQPILERAFDPWSLNNEQFYNELSYAINKGDLDLFEAVIKKYDVKYLFLDKTILNSITRGPVNYLSLERFLESSKMLIEKKVFGSLIIYEVLDSDSPLYTLDGGNTEKLFPTLQFSNKDTAYKTFPDYVFEDKTPDAAYIIPSFYTGKLQGDLAFEADDRNDSIILRPKKYLHDLNSTNPTLELPSLFANETMIPVEITVFANRISFSPIYPKIKINSHLFQPREQKLTAITAINDPLSIEFIDTKNTVSIVNGKAKAFILNHYINSIKVRGENKEQTITLDTQGIQEPSYFMPLPKEQIETIEIIVDKFNNSLNINEAVTEKLFSIKKNSDVFNIFPVNLGMHEAENKGLSFSALGNSSFDISFYRDNLLHQGSYIIFIDSKYKSGLPVGFYVENSFNRRPEIESKLAKRQTKNVFVLPKTEAAFSGYGFHIVIKSVGREQTESAINKISVFPFPEETISNIKIVLNGNYTKPKNTRHFLSAEKINSSLYEARLDENVAEGAYLVLSQSFDPGWKAYQVKNHESRIMNYASLALPFMFGDEIKQQVEVNGWANGWLIDSPEFRVQNSELVIVYLPQYLEYAGFAILFLTTSFILIKILPKHRS